MKRAELLSVLLPPSSLRMPARLTPERSGADHAVALAAAGTPRQLAAVEWPTFALALVIYAGWLAVSWWWRELPASLLVILGGWLLAWHGSLQHETIHGHPTRLRWLNKAFGFPPLGLCLPYELYRRSHLRHHRNSHLTDPVEDPESAYLTARAWRRLGPVGRALQRASLTLGGRILLGPILIVVRLLKRELVRLAAGNRKRRRIWIHHLTAVSAILGWVALVCHMPLWIYVSAFVYPGMALTQLRAFAEHRWAADPAHRTAIVEASLFGILFLHNNLHAVHHALPQLPWYRLPAVYRAARAEFLRDNGGLLYHGYADVARRFLWRLHDVAVHPLHPDATSPREASIPGNCRSAAMGLRRA
jgi:fatty acid desaturase